MAIEFPKGIEHGPHAQHQIHLSQCFTAPLSWQADEALQRGMEARHRHGTGIGKHAEFGNAAVQGGARNSIAQILGTDPANITLTVNTNDGLYIVKQGLGLRDGAKVVLYGAEYLDVKTPFISRPETFSDCIPVFIDGARDGRRRPLGFDLAEFERAMKSNIIKLAVVTQVQFPNGFTTDVPALAAICKRYDVPLVVDLAQSFGIIPFNPEEAGVAAVVAPLWKWAGGLRGTGFLWTAPGFRGDLKIARLSASGMRNVNWDTDVTTAQLQPDARDRETSTLPTESWFATRAALGQIERFGVAGIEQEVRTLHQFIREHLLSSRIKIFESTGDGGSGSFVAFTLEGPAAGKEQEVVDRLRAAHKQFDVTARCGFIRFAPGYFTPADDLIDACKTAVRIVNEL